MTEDSEYDKLVKSFKNRLSVKMKKVESSDATELVLVFAARLVAAKNPPPDEFLTVHSESEPSGPKAVRGWRDLFPISERKLLELQKEAIQWQIDQVRFFVGYLIRSSHP